MDKKDLVLPSIVGHGAITPNNDYLTRVQNESMYHLF